MDQSQKESFSEETIEFKNCCADCKTTNTPLWRGGPSGPKSLCNACGIRFRKKGNGVLGVKREAEKSKEVVKLSVRLMSLGNQVVKLHKRQRSPIKRQTCRISKFLGEEEQAALVLMALSCPSVSYME